MFLCLVSSDVVLNHRDGISFRSQVGSKWEFSAEWVKLRVVIWRRSKLTTYQLGTVFQGFLASGIHKLVFRRVSLLGFPSTHIPNETYLFPAGHDVRNWTEMLSVIPVFSNCICFCICLTVIHQMIDKNFNFYLCWIYDYKYYGIMLLICGVSS
jgi:hypothetical protein